MNAAFFNCPVHNFRLYLLIASGLSGTLLNSFRYVDVPHVTLPIGDYVVGAHFIGTFVDPFSDFNLSLSTHPFIEYQGRNGAGPGFQFPSTFLGTDGLNFITSNFQFLVPESGTLLLGSLAGLGLLLKRQNGRNRELRKAVQRVAR